MLNETNSSTYKPSTSSFKFKKRLLSEAIVQTLAGGSLLREEETMKQYSNSSLVLEIKLLNRAKEVQRLLAETSELPETRPVMQRRLQAYIDSLESSIKLLLKQDYKIAFIGGAGVGKSTAICELLGLVTSNGKKGARSVLQANGGRTTVCEVQVIEGNVYGIETMPCTIDELREYVQDYAEHLLAATQTEIEDANPDAESVSQEVMRVLLNMTGLKDDDAKELAKRFTSKRELTIKLMELIKLPERDCKEIYYKSDEEIEPLMWLKANFRKINKGLHPNFSLPTLIKVIVPFELLSHQECSSVLVVDTKGIDGTALRKDLSCHLENQHTLTVLCTRFNNAPDTEARLFLENAIKCGIPSLSLNSLLLVLPHHDEALAVNTTGEEEIETIEEGYKLKHEEIKTALTPSKLNDLPIYFFNSREDDATKFRAFLNERITAMRDNLRQQLISTIQDAENVLANYEEGQYLAIQYEASEMLQSWINTNSDISPSAMLIHDDLIRDIKEGVNAGKVRATINYFEKKVIKHDEKARIPDDLNYYHYLENGTDSLVTSLLASKVSSFDSLCKVVSNNPKLSEAKALTNQASDVLWRTYFYHLKDTVKTKSKELFSIELLNFATELWEKSAQEWGRKDLEGAAKKLKYRDRVANHHKEWFAEQRRVDLEQQVYNLIVAEWKLALDKVCALLETE